MEIVAYLALSAILTWALIYFGVKILSKQVKKSKERKADQLEKKQENENQETDEAYRQALVTAVNDTTMKGKMYFHRFINGKIPYTLLLNRDEFDESLVLSFYNFNNEKTDKIETYVDEGDYTFLAIGFRFESGVHYMTLQTIQKNLKFNEGDEFILLFEDSKTIELKIEQNGVKVGKGSEGIEIETMIAIPSGVIEKMQSDLLMKWRYISHKDQAKFTSTLQTLTSKHLFLMAHAYNEARKILE